MAIQNGDTVKVHYTGKLSDGEVFDSSKGREPLEFVIGAGQVIPGFEAAVLGKEAGDHITVTIPPEQGYAYDPELVFTIKTEQMPDSIPLKVGTPVHLSNEQGHMDAVITEVGPEEITLDANMPLAGKELIFDIDVVASEPGKQAD